jgi:hypothetical protein
MPALFSPSSNRVLRLAIAVGAVAVIGIPVFLMAWVRSPMVTGQFAAPEQPLPFSHQLHVSGFGIDCRYCHSTVERAASAGIPATATCIPCHNRAWREGLIFAPVRQSLATGRPIPWVRANRLPDFVYFDHAIHVNKGVGCETCHGRVDRMATVQQTAPLTMGWCLDCHRNPESRLRPVEQMVAMGWRPPTSQAVLGAELARRYHVQRVVSCTGCHR